MCSQLIVFSRDTPDTWVPPVRHHRLVPKRWKRRSDVDVYRLPSAMGRLNAEWYIRAGETMHGDRRCISCELQCRECVRLPMWHWCLYCMLDGRAGCGWRW
ncbi:hypothetical protein CALCODRAFT_367823 [Calocera cornea HHB12733]|uniref:Uncharacterized protein n=1 Tax=Calocera cornea HHB12733 TaxID=1353952 RepID=A0A165JBI7_9BASI|nr:hypothetical protein CALCODRAFT_367823 [Calocera cornea HHB12733]